MLHSTYRKLARFLQDKRNRLFVDVTVTSLATYFLIKKTFGWSLTSALLEVFQTNIVDYILLVLILVFLYAAIAKILLIIADAYPATRIKNSEVEAIMHCCMRINNEIAVHVDRILEEPPSLAATFTQNHNFQLNVANVMDSMAHHLIATLSGAKAKDIFISVYQICNFKNLEAERASLQYVCHFPMKKDGIAHKVIPLDDNSFSEYECVKCIRAPDHTWIKLDCSNYFKSQTHRHKKIRHYIGMKLLHNETLLGFVNIEFSNTSFFGNDEEMRSYLEENILTFKYLIEYQFLKSAFFHILRPSLATKE